MTNVQLENEIDCNMALPGGASFHVPGELVDVSFSLPRDHKVVLLHGKSASQWTTLKDGFRVPTLEHILDELWCILLVEKHLPWRDDKVDKRITRFVLGSICLATKRIGGNNNDVSFRFDNIGSPVMQSMLKMTSFLYIVIAHVACPLALDINQFKFRRSPSAGVPVVRRFQSFAGRLPRPRSKNRQ